MLKRVTQAPVELAQVDSPTAPPKAGAAQKARQPNQGKTEDLYGKASRAAERAKQVRDQQGAAGAIYGANVGFEAVDEPGATEPPEKAKDAAKPAQKKPSAFWQKAARWGAAIGLGVSMLFNSAIGQVPLNAVPEADPCAAAALVEVGVSACTTGNQMSYFVDGPAYVDALVQNIDASTSSIWLEWFHVGPDASVEPVMQALQRAHARGVTVNMVIDNRQSSGEFNEPLNQRVNDEMIARFRAMGATVQMPSYGLYSVNHRKMGVFDGQRAMVMGQNLGGNYTLPLSEGWTYHDMGFVLSGPAVRDVAASFVDSWVRAGGASLSLPDRMTPFAAGAYVDAQVQVVSHNAMSDRAIERELVQRIDAATVNDPITLTNGFAMSSAILHSVLRARDRGVEVTWVWGPASKDATLMAQGDFAALQEAGVHVVKLSVPLHMKLYLVGNYVIAGSANLDGFSGTRNDEMSLQIHSAALARDLLNHLIALDIAKGQPMTGQPVTPNGLRDRAVQSVLPLLVH